MAAMEVGMSADAADTAQTPLARAGIEAERQRQQGIWEVALHAMHCVTEVTVTSLGDLQRKDRGVNDSRSHCTSYVALRMARSPGRLSWHTQARGGVRE